MSQPGAETARLILRPFCLDDAPEVRRLAGRREIADTTLAIPHPYPRGAAEAWIGKHEDQHALGKGTNFAITLRNGSLIGAIGLVIAAEHRRAELGYWIAVDHWGNGYATEAARAVVRYGFETLGLEKIHSCFLARNPASGRVLAKVGMTIEGVRRRHVVKWDRPEDLVVTGLLREDFDASQA
jgi:RimJ/RimL family protein N-acetyltransferase